MLGDKIPWELNGVMFLHRFFPYVSLKGIPLLEDLNGIYSCSFK